MDNPVIKHPHTLEPYIPGSSLKGKARFLLEWAFNTVRDDGKAFGFDDCGRDGAARRRRRDPAPVWHGRLEGGVDRGPTRLMVRDAPLERAWRNRMDDEGRLLTEDKTEVSIDRIAGKALDGGLRQSERVPAGARFDVEIGYRMWSTGGDEGHRDRQCLAWFIQALHLIEQDALGGSGSRGYGQVVFRDLRLQGPRRRRTPARQCLQGRAVRPERAAGADHGPGRGRLSPAEPGRLIHAAPPRPIRLEGPIVSTSRLGHDLRPVVLGDARGRRRGGARRLGWPGRTTLWAVSDAFPRRLPAASATQFSDRGRVAAGVAEEGKRAPANAKASERKTLNRKPFVSRAGLPARREPTWARGRWARAISPAPRTSRIARRATASTVTPARRATTAASSSPKKSGRATARPSATSTSKRRPPTGERIGELLEHVGEQRLRQIREPRPRAVHGRSR